MKFSLLAFSFLFPVALFAQEVPSLSTGLPPVTERQAEPPVIPAEPTSMSAVTPAPLAPQIAPDIQTRSRQAFLYSLFPTLGGFTGAVVFSSLGTRAGAQALLNGTSLVPSRLLLGLGSVSGVVALVGPSVGHYWAGDNGRGTSLLLRRILIPAGIAAGGIVLTVVGGARVLESDGADGAGLAVGGLLLLVSSGAVYGVQAIIHVLDARQAPERVAKKSGGVSNLLIGPAPVAVSRTGSLVPGLSLSMNF